MSEFEWHKAGNTEARQKLGASYLFEQSATVRPRRVCCRGLL